MSPLIYQWINIIVLFSVLGVVLRKKLGAYFAEQRTTLDQQIKSVGAEHDRIKAEFNAIQKSVNELDSKIADLESLSLKEIELETKRVETEAKKAIEKIAIDGEARLKNETERMKKILERELFDSALSLAKEGLQKEAKEQGQDWIAQVVQPEATDGKKNYAS